MQGLKTYFIEKLQALVPDIVAQIVKSLGQNVPSGQVQVNVPMPRSLMVQKSAPETAEMSQIKKLALQSTIGQIQ